MWRRWKCPLSACTPILTCCFSCLRTAVEDLAAAGDAEVAAYVKPPILVFSEEASGLVEGDAGDLCPRALALTMNATVSPAEVHEELVIFDLAYIVGE